MGVSNEKGDLIMDYSVLERSTLFRGVPAERLREVLQNTPHHIQCYDKEETIFRMMEPAQRIGIVLEGRVQAQKAFPKYTRYSDLAISTSWLLSNRSASMT